MPDKGKHGSTTGVEPRIVVAATDIDGVASALGLELLEEPESDKSPDCP